jgi:polyribonucleotide 5'-hydroxyl-kinase
LIKGKAEIFGTEIAIGQTSTFYGGTQLAVFSWHGCTLRVTGKCRVEYTASDTPMTSYLNAHTMLETRRIQALASGKCGPRVRRVVVEVTVGGCGGTEQCR